MSEVIEPKVSDKAEQQLIISPISGRIGAQISGVKLSSALAAETVQQIYQALLKYKVIFFRNQQHLDDQEQEKFAALLGEPVRHPTVPTVEGTQYLLELDSRYGGRANSWHTDVTFVDAYPKLSILRGVTIPEFGGDTTWANTETAYDELPEVLKELANHLRAIHSNDYDYVGLKPDVDPDVLAKYKNIFASVVYETEHPVVRVHPETGKRSLLLGHFFKRFVGLNARESSRIYDVLQDRVIRPENTVRWRWQAGDVAIWDNRATQHLAVNDYGDAHRVVRRVTLAGDVPVGVDGRNSITISPKGLSAAELEQAKRDAVLAAK
ncbi:TauD/TfdA family dioxygenase [Acinetobacter puyangensis]|uniref:Taurine dioxygenase n=1 Tax=Acinetobacter puyangensis TaxID=1096779 RepID=A0A240EDH1_9GAMM|nr:TauD/TfdA family dioxygenase [Acinetobacter puyangensis]SNX45950.1 taurine dioxygenase [Acinetobacter puyangensis]